LGLKAFCLAGNLTRDKLSESWQLHSQGIYFHCDRHADIFFDGCFNELLEFELSLLLGFNTKVSMPGAGEKSIKDALEGILSSFNGMLSG